MHIIKTENRRNVSTFKKMTQFDQLFVYLELYAGQGTLSAAACEYARKLGFKHVVALAVECRAPSRIKGSTLSDDVVWLTRRVEEIDPASFMGYIRTLCKERFGTTKTPIIVGHASPTCTAHSIANTRGDKKEMPYDQALAQHAFCMLRALCGAAFSVEHPWKSAMLSAPVWCSLNPSHAVLQTRVCPLHVVMFQSLKFLVESTQSVGSLPKATC